MIYGVNNICFRLNLYLYKKFTQYIMVYSEKISNKLAPYNMYHIIISANVYNVIRNIIVGMYNKLI